MIVKKTAITKENSRENKRTAEYLNMRMKELVDFFCVES